MTQGLKTETEAIMKTQSAGIQKMDNLGKQELQMQEMEKRITGTEDTVGDIASLLKKC